MKILGIETSADETAVAVVENGTILLSSVISSSLTLHNKTGGIVPEVASREHLKYLLPALHQALEKSSVALSQIDRIAVTMGPGLIGSLLMGVETAKTISFVTGKKIIPVNHIFAHLYANWIGVKDEIKFPAVGVIISGGHSEIFLLKSHTDWKWLGGTLDDAAGEAFDKTARLLSLPYPGGPEISKKAKEFETKKKKSLFRLPRPMIGSNDYNFSFSGLKTAVMREMNKIGSMDNESVSMFSYEIQESITDVIVHKTIKAVKEHHVPTLLFGGGVSANKRLSEKLKIENLKLKISLYVPPPSLCTDNAAAIASYAYFHNDEKSWEEIEADPELSVEV